jgi:hypothetical protein
MMQHIQQGVIDMQYLPTERMPANLLTKPVPVSELKEMLPHMMGIINLN